MQIKLQAIKMNKLEQLIQFDKVHLIDVMLKIGIPQDQVAPPLTPAELTAAIKRNDPLFWVTTDNENIGYLWLEKKADYLYIAGLALEEYFWGQGLMASLMDFSEKTARASGLNVCRSLVIPSNGRAMNAYFKLGYLLVGYQEVYAEGYPKTFRGVMEKKLLANEIKTFTEEIEVSASDHGVLKESFDKGYLGVGYLKSENKIIFVR